MTKEIDKMFCALQLISWSSRVWLDLNAVAFQWFLCQDDGIKFHSFRRGFAESNYQDGGTIGPLVSGV